MINNQPSSQTNMQEQFSENAVPIGLPWRIMIFSAVIFILSIFISFGLKIGYEKYLDGELSKINTNISALSSSVEQKQQEYVNFYSQVINLKTVIQKRNFTGNIFSFLEKNTVNSVFYTDAQMDSSQNKLSVKGFAKSLGDVSQQIAVFENDKNNITNVVLDGVNIQSGGVVFSLSIYFNQSFFANPL